ncbi:MAG TPA: hypothetical protein VHZ24_12745 [Pirellulales bacterium]|jgi:hypothetical protein|nr:hypothetical protein [Pirellulales bacterium]
MTAKRDGLRRLQPQSMGIVKTFGLFVVTALAEILGGHSPVPLAAKGQIATARVANGAAPGDVPTRLSPRKP